MVRPAPNSFNPEQVARKPEKMSVAFPLTRCKRLVSLIAGHSHDLADDSAESIHADQNADQDKVDELPESSENQGADLVGEIIVNQRGGHIVVSGQYTTEYTLECQRCLQFFQFPVSGTFDLTLVENQAAADALPEELDPLIVSEEGVLSLVDIFEDELILQVPTVPRHADVEQCNFEVEVELEAHSDTALRDGQVGKQSGREVFAELKNLTFDKD